jgi:thioredoxin 1
MAQSIEMRPALRTPSARRIHVTGRSAHIALLLVSLTLVAAAPALARKAPKPAAPAALPRLVDLGAHKCIPCKRMAPILDELRRDYAGVVDVQFIDVWQNPQAGTPYRIRLIPTQVFFDAKGRERFRHEGFFAREEIERIFRDSLGVAARPAGKK